MEPDDNGTATIDNEATADSGEGFDEGFDSDQSSAVATPTETPENTPADKAPEQAPPEYVQLTRADLDQIRSGLTSLAEVRAAQEKGLSTAFGKLGGIERKLQAFDAGKRIEIEQSEIDDLRNDGFESHAKALEKLRDLRVVGGGVDPEELDKRVQERLAPAISELRQTFETRLLKRVHPDWQEYQTNPDFESWVLAQPEEYRAKLTEASNAWDSDFIADAMTKAKEAAKKKAAAATPASDPASTRRSRMNAAVSPRGTGSVPASSDIDEFDAGFRGP